MRTALDAANGYMAVSNETDPAERVRRLEAWHPDVCYFDPLMQAEGSEALTLMIEGARAQFPGLAFRLHGTLLEVERRIEVWRPIQP
ncbi:hypothetical protein GCM10011390_26790 [Aureimonas endophytica]|uniref:Uncharacterized protein n=1 Tax=Aureimonas endophytica TaxID=2027858 RepID=A0A916ZNJ0_9HYPH|nr:nuclear transport factor 2 family protein [Aureimonas endophytica]GGE06299.1 hypothetical protein GCM10011390_26790 [Aureimonas endophytica]